MMKTMLFASAATLFVSTAAIAAAPVASSNTLKDEYQDVEQREYVPFVASDGLDAARGPNGPAGGYVVQSFEGISQYNVAAYGRNFIPPDTMGAVGNTQYSEFVNGGFAVYSKAGGGVVKATSDVAFWQAAGQSSANGDTRVAYLKDSNRWMALSFGASTSNIQIAVSDTSNAAGTWKSTIFTGYAGGTADYPTLGIDKNAVYIGTNNFNANGNFRGTTLNVIPLASLVSAVAPTTTGITQFVTPYDPVNGGADGGFAIQGVNSDSGNPTGHVLAVSLFNADTIRYDVSNAGTPGAAKVNAVYIGTAGYDGNGAGRQPNAVADAFPNATFPDNNRVIDTLDDRYGSAVFEQNGRIYAVHTVTPTGTDFTVVRYEVIDAATNAILDEGDIGDGAHDFYQGSINVNSHGQVVIAYNRSGSNSLDGNITFAAQVFSTGIGGLLTARGGEQVLKVSLIDDYHNGSIAGRVAAGRQRWGDYSSVTLDPTDGRSFWAIGEFAREYNNPAGGHPGGTGGSRWGTWISELNVGTTVPEPGSWAMMIAGFGIIGAARRRQRRLESASA